MALFSLVSQDINFLARRIAILAVTVVTDVMSEALLLRSFDRESSTVQTRRLAQRYPPGALPARPGATPIRTSGTQTITTHHCL